MFFPSDRTIIIAEAGVNHDGDINKALELVQVAKDANADFVKFQAYRAEKLALPIAEQSSYIIDGSYENESFQDLLKRIEMSFENHRIIKKACDELNIKFLSTAFDNEGLDFLCDEMQCEVIKVASADLTNISFLRHAASKKLPIILSTGMADLQEIDEAIDTLKTNGASEICILHCVSWYPCSYEIANLRAMLTLAERYKLPVGYSDHTLGVDLPPVAVGMGACVIEKHYTIDPTDFGPDHKASLDPTELKEMVSRIRKIETALGDGAKNLENISQTEIKQRRVHRRSVVSSQDIKKGEIFTLDNLDIRRPGTGIKPKELDNILGLPSLNDIEKETLLTISDYTP